MSHRRTGRKKDGHAGKSPIRTSVLELVQELSRLTDDDNLVMAAVKSIFCSHTVRNTHSLAPVRLVAAGRFRGSRLKTVVGCKT